MRKLILCILALGLAFGAFWIYRLSSPMKTIPVSDETFSGEFDETSNPDDTRMVGDTAVETIKRTRYVRLDPVTKEIRQEYGFSELINSQQDSPFWQVRNPYMIRYEPRSTVRIDADWGRMEMEQLGSEMVLRNAELRDNVTIRIFRSSPENQQESTLEMDDLSYSSERSEFFTEGPVHVIASDAELTGRGLLLLYDPRLEQLEYMKVKSVSLLRLKNMVASGNPPLRNEESSAKPDVSSGHSEAVVQSAPASDSNIQKPIAIESESGNTNPSAETMAPSTTPEGRFYQCSILENVEIRYGNDLVVFGVDQVNINRVLWGSGSRASEPEISPAGNHVSDEPVQKASKQPSAPDREPVLPQTPSTEDEKDILVTCDGGIVVQPMEAAGTAISAGPEIEMQGRALQIDKIQERSGQVPLVSCQILKYAWTPKILELFPAINPVRQRPITLYLDRDGGEIETEGSVFWDRQANWARITGPGKILFASPGVQADRRGQLLFGGLMNLLFTESSVKSETSSLLLKTAEISGGMTTELPRQGLRSRADHADFYFGPSNTPQRIDMNGDVEFETLAEADRSSAAAAKSTLLFDTEGMLQSAQLDGDVRMTTGEGSILGGTAFIVFGANESGQSVARRIEVADQPVMLNPSNTESPARFEAVRIDYDYQSGQAVATGPIEFTFYARFDSDQSELAPTPVVITAQDRAEFLTDGRNRIQQVSFYGNVIGTSELKTDNERLIRRFYGGTMDVFLTEDASGPRRIRQIVVKDGDVKLQSIHYYNGQKVNHVELACLQFDYDGLNERITAAGPGTIQLNNQEVPSDSSISQSFDLEQPCYAFVRDFDRLSWNLAADTLLAYGSKGIYIGYIPVTDGRLGDKVEVECMHASAQLSREAGGKNQLRDLLATGGIVYRETGEGGHFLEGEKLTMQGDTPWITVEGSPNRPCTFDNIRLPIIRYDPVTRRLKSRLNSATGPVQIP